jgi:hypothetical protein
MRGFGMIEMPSDGRPSQAREPLGERKVQR